jgi:DNA polymerase III epsilon subunit-like protein
MFLFFDTETTWLPADYTAPFSDSENWPRLVQIARLVYDKKNNLTKKTSYIIKPEWFTIPREASRVHGITTAKAKKEGKKLSVVLKDFLKDLSHAEHVIAHNISFDIAIVAAECCRNWQENPFVQKQTFCTMKELAHIAAIPGKRWFKRPTMTELYTAIFWKPFAGAHDALADIEACAACYRDVFGTEKKTKKNAISKKYISQEKKSPKKKKQTPLVGTFQFDTIGNRALELMTEGKRNIFLTGKAGTGKSTLLLTFLEKNIKNTAVVAPTGVAAVNIWGATIHSFFWFPPTVTVDHARKEGKMRKGDPLFAKLQTVVIDEISMVRADLFDCMDIFLQTARWSTKPFGGVQMICIWDIYQLPPVVTSTERKFFETVYKSPYFFDAHVFQHPKRHMEFIELEKIYRQTDENFVTLLNAVRNKTVDDMHLSLCNQRVVGAIKNIPDGMLYLTGEKCHCWWNKYASTCSYQRKRYIVSCKHWGRYCKQTISYWWNFALKSRSTGYVCCE